MGRIQVGLQVGLVPTSQGTALPTQHAASAPPDGPPCPHPLPKRGHTRRPRLRTLRPQYSSLDPVRHSASSFASLTLLFSFTKILTCIVFYAPGTWQSAAFQLDRGSNFTRWTAPPLQFSTSSSSAHQEIKALTN